MVRARNTADLPSIERLRELLRVDEEGRLFWRGARRGVRAGGRAGCARPDGYRVVMIDRCLVREHRVVFALANNRWPREGLVIDHIDGNPTNNSPKNLREIGQSQNLMNSIPASQGASGVKGVSKYAPSGKWRAYITVANRQVSLGYFDEKDDAVSARRLAEEKYFGEYRRKREPVKEEARV